MKTQTFDNGSVTLELTKVVDTKSDYTPTHFFTVKFDDGDTDEVGINMNNKNNLGKWLQDNCDIENTIENIDLFNNLLK